MKYQTKGYGLADHPPWWWHIFELLLTLKFSSLSANNYAQKNKRKTLTAPDVFEALEEMEFEQFVKPLKESLACKYD